MSKERFEIVFVVLVYRNTQDLKDFFLHNHLRNSHTVVVNSYFDDASEGAFRQIAIKNGASFLSVENKGYGAGNNAGCKYAIDHYDFKWLIISNADIMIERMDTSVFDNYTNEIIAPKILNLKGKNQNPGGPYKPSKLEEKLKYIVYQHNLSHFIIFFYILSRIKKYIYSLFNKYNKRKEIYSAHGAFVVFAKKTVEKLYPFYFEEMFLFNEEGFLARRALEKNIKTIYDERLVIRHKEDGSISMLEEKNFHLMRDSYMKYYDYFNKLKA